MIQITGFTNTAGPLTKRIWLEGDTVKSDGSACVMVQGYAEHDAALPPKPGGQGRRPTADPTTPLTPRSRARRKAGPSARHAHAEAP
jgi:hypothetical protein